MNQAELDGLVGGVIAEIWTHFRAARAWPLKKPIMLALRGKGAGFDEVVKGSRGRLLRASNGSEERVFTTFRALASLDEVRQLLSPLPALMREAARRFVQHHRWAGESENEAVRITFADILKLWPDTDAALLVARLLHECSGSPLQYSGATGPSESDVHFRPTIRTLRHEKVQTLDEILRIEESIQRIDVGHYPSGDHLKVLRLIWAAALKDGKWPIGLPFAIENRELGDVRQLLEELSPRFLKGGFRDGQYDTLSLTPRAVEFIDPDGDGKAALVAIARTAAELWASSGNSSRVDLPEIAKKAGLQASTVNVWSLLLEWEPWGNLNREAGRAFYFSIHDEACLKNEHLDSWSTYMATWHPESDRFSQDATGVFETTAPAGNPGLRIPALSFLSSASLRQVVEADLRELEILRASGASKAIFVIAGSLIEGVLVDVLSLQPALAASLLKKNHARWPKDAGLSDLIEGAVKYGLVQPSVVPLLQVLKNYRDLVHPVNMSTTALRARPDSAELVLQALNVVLNDLEEARQRGKITEFQSL